MIGNLGKVDNRLKMYWAAPDKRFEVKTGLTPHEETVKQRVRQYWSDQTIPVAKKMEGFNINLSGFDPRRTTNRQLLEISVLMAESGLIDDDLAASLSRLDARFDEKGNTVDMDREIDAYEFLSSQLSRLGTSFFEDNEIAKGEMIEVRASISILKALETFARAPRERSLVNIRV